MTEPAPGLEVMIEDPRWTEAGLEALAARALGAVLDRFGLGDAEVVVLGCDDARIADLNAGFRDKRAPTNVLSWPAQALEPAAPGATPPAPRPDPFDGSIALGDIAIAFETCAREAVEQGKSQGDHVTHLLVHGCLHLLGFDHETEKDAALMEGIETETLASLGIADPY